jgi:predicted dehydrogenase
MEKVFALDASQAREMIEAAHRNQVFLMEAFWTRFQPSFLRVLEILKSGELGAPAMMRSEFCFYSPYDPETRLFSKALGGGSLLDIGIYPVFWALQLFGRPSEIQVTADIAPTGVDRSIAMTFNYQDKKIAQLASSFNACSETQTEIWCEKGFIRQRKIDPSTVKVTINRKGISEEEEVFHFDNQEFGLFLEAKHVMECLDAGLTESPVLPHSATLEQMEVLDAIRQKAEGKGQKLVPQ